MNPRSRISSAHRSLLVLATLALLGWPASAAQADAVVLLRPVGELPDAELDALEESLEAAIRAVGHEIRREAHASRQGAGVMPETANEMQAIAEIQGAGWVVSARALPQPGGVHLLLRVGWASGARVEELEAEVRSSRVGPRLEALLGALLRPEGLGAEVEHLAGEDLEARRLEALAAEAAAERERLEQARAQEEAEARREQERLDSEARARLAAEAEDREAEEAERARRWEDRERYGQPPGWMPHLGLATRAIARTDSGRGGTLGALELMASRSFEGAPGLQLRFGMDIGFGASSGFGLHAGAVYLLSPLASTPLHVGGGLDIGLYRAITGNDVTSFRSRLGPIVAYHLAGSLFIEAQPELLYLSANGGVLTLGVAIRAGLAL
ncbi:MAG: hypothetical protein OEY14_09225 [Myxococcales bacterium]|nr:hypothetical protein [Myxococcales bacterium]